VTKITEHSHSGSLLTIAPAFLAVSSKLETHRAVRKAVRKLADGSVRHGGQGLMSWTVANARVEPKGDAITITKQASGDPLMAAFNAIALMFTNPWSHQAQMFVI
jgi:phage terminase large subunit-like protein